MDSSIKTLTITGSAASSGSEAKKSRRGSRRKKIEDEGFEQSEPIQPIQPIQPIKIEKSFTPLITKNSSAATASFTSSGLSAPSTPSAPLTPFSSKVSLIQKPVEKQEPKPITPVTSVILNPPKVQRIKLQPKTYVQHVQKQVAGTRKARKISLSVSNLNHRFTRAKRVHDDTQKKPIDTIRSYLVEKGVIQTKSKAPERMLRSMYNDFNMLKDGQAL
jgi:hypothetical protein